MQYKKCLGGHDNLQDKRILRFVDTVFVDAVQSEKLDGIVRARPEAMLHIRQVDLYKLHTEKCRPWQYLPADLISGAWQYPQQGKAWRRPPRPTCGHMSNSVSVVLWAAAVRRVSWSISPVKGVATGRRIAGQRCRRRLPYQVGNGSLKRPASARCMVADVSSWRRSASKASANLSSLNPTVSIIGVFAWARPWRRASKACFLCT